MSSEENEQSAYDPSEDGHEDAQSQTADHNAYDEAEGDAGENDIAPELQEQIEKQIAKFRKLWLMLDSNVEGERNTAFNGLYRTMGKINELHTQATGEEGSLSFADLLDKIEQGGGGDPEEIEHLHLVIAQYEEANEALKIAEDMMRRELRMLRFMMQTKSYDQVQIDNPRAVLTKFIEQSDVYQNLCDTLREMIESDGTAVHNAYTKRLSDLQEANYEKRAALYHGIGAQFTSWLIRQRGLPATAEDLMEIQSLAKAQDRLLREENRILLRIKDFEETVQQLDEVLRCVLHKSRIDDTMQDMLKNIEQLEVRLQEMESLQEQLAEAEQSSSSLQTTITELQEDNARKQESIRVLDETIESLKQALKIHDPINHSDTNNLNLDDPADLRKACKLLVQHAMDKPRKDIKKDDIKRDNALLREQVAMLQDGAKEERFEIIARDALKKLLQVNEELEEAAAKYKKAYDKMLGDSATLEERYERDYKQKVADIKARHITAVERLQTQHAEALAEQEAALKAEKDERVDTLQIENAQLRHQLHRMEQERASYRRGVQTEAGRQSLRGQLIGGAFAIVAGAGGFAIIDKHHPEYIPWNSADTTTAEQAQPATNEAPVVTAPMPPALPTQNGPR